MMISLTEKRSLHVCMKEERTPIYFYKNFIEK